MLMRAWVMVLANLDLFPAVQINNPRALAVNPVAQASDIGACRGLTT